MEDINLYLPRDKHDFERVAQLHYLDKSILIPIIPTLVEWLQDINWPIAMEVANVLLKHPAESIPHIKNVLKTKDDIWKEWCLRFFVEELPNPYIEQFRADLIRIAYSPTEGELLEEVNETALKILDLMKNDFNHPQLQFVMDIMGDFNKPWLIAGGWAVDLGLGCMTREHEDIDICVYREDAQAVLDYLKDWEIKVAVPGEHRLVDYEQLSDLSLPRYCLHLFRGDDFLEILFTERLGDEILFRKNNNITMPMEQFALRDTAERPFVNPVWQLLFKSLAPREKDLADFQQYLPLLKDEEKRWLTNGIRLMKPDSDWLDKLSV
nr:DUF5071 domain-containing protein [Paenibacillus luteus]